MDACVCVSKESEIKQNGKTLKLVTVAKGYVGVCCTSLNFLS